MYGRDGLSLGDYWAKGMRTFHGFLSHGFPNCFHMGLTQTGLTANFNYMLNKQAHHVAQLLTEVNRRNAKSIEPTPEAEAGVVADREWYEPDDEVPKRVYAGVLQRRGNKRGRLSPCRVSQGGARLFRPARPLA